jgi:cephalosporin hydroxylase
MNKKNKIVIENDFIEHDNKTINLYSPEGFKLISDLWVKVGWDQKYLYSFSWLGRPIIQNPEDMLRIQEVIYDIEPNLVIETGVAHGGSLIYYASILNAMGKGKVVGIDIDIRKHNRKEIEEHKLFTFIDLIEGSSIDLETFAKVEALINPNDKVIVILDSAHDYLHVKKEIELYSSMVSVGSYIVVTDGSQEYLGCTPRAKVDYAGYVETWEENNPKKAAEDFVLNNNQYEIVEPSFPFNEGAIDFRVTHWPSAFIKKIS